MPSAGGLTVLPDRSVQVLRQYAELKTTDLFPDNPADVRLSDQSTYELLQQLPCTLTLFTVEISERGTPREARRLAAPQISK